MERQLQQILTERIPLTQAMGLQVREAGARVVLAFPLALNHNHKCTAFGGSLYSAAVLAGWAWLEAAMLRRGWQGHLVIQREGQYRIIYKPAGTQVYVMVIADGRRDFRRLLAG
jgi:thioesterase domain-containing protein